MPPQSLHVIVQSNGFGVAGFVVSLISFFCCGLTAPLGLLMSVIALAWPPRGFAFAGTLLGALGSWWLFFGGFALLMSMIGSSTTQPSIAEPPHIELPATSTTREAAGFPSTKKEDDRGLLAEPAPVAENRASAERATVPTSPELPQDERPAEAAPRPIRTWHSASGKFSTDAEFLSAGLGKVKLRKADGTELTLELDQLSEDDRNWIADYARSKR
jgi:hypothetical protein